MIFLNIGILYKKNSRIVIVTLLQNDFQDVILINGHSPDVPTAKEVKEEGLKTGETIRLLTQKSRRAYALHFTTAEGNRDLEGRIQ